MLGSIIFVMVPVIIKQLQCYLIQWVDRKTAIYFAASMRVFPGRDTLAIRSLQLQDGQEELAFVESMLLRSL